VQVGFVFISTDEAPLLDAALAAAVAEAPDDVLVADNACTDDFAAVAERHGARVLRLDERRPYSEVMNRLLREVRGDAVAMLQADTFVRPGYKDALARVLAEDPEVGAVAPKLLRTSGPRPEDRLGEIDAAGMSLDRRRKNGLVAHGQPEGAYAHRAEVFGADGAAALYRRATLDDVAPDGEVFDESISGWACDADLAWRTRVQGWRAVYEPAALVDHIRTYSPSTRSAVGAGAQRMQFRNRYLMILKNDTARELARDLPVVLLYELLALGYAVLRERHLLGGYREAWVRRAGARRRRRAIDARRRARSPYGLEAPATAA
jgi:GT2 family glycosyltransferase